MIKTLTEDIHYKVVAIDKSFNYSAYSLVLTLRRPDVIPPAIAVMLNAEHTDNGIDVKWIASSSTDVVVHKLFRKEGVNGEWKNVFETKNKNEVKYLDDKVIDGQKYFYKIHAFDEIGQMSDESNFIEVIVRPKPIMLDQLNLKANKSDNYVKLEWNNLKNSKKYLLYKTNKNGQYIQIANTNKTQYIDQTNDLKSKYAIRIITNNGMFSDFSKPTSISN
jgi:fibronectin type 3 domain-containing protein